MAQSLAELMRQKKAAEEANKKPAVSKPIKKKQTKARKTVVKESQDDIEFKKTIARKEKAPRSLTVDAMRGIYWLITQKSDYKRLKREELKEKLDDHLTTKEGMRKFLKALEVLIFS